MPDSLAPFFENARELAKFIKELHAKEITEEQAKKLYDHLLTLEKLTVIDIHLEVKKFLNTLIATGGGAPPPGGQLQTILTEKKKLKHAFSWALPQDVHEGEFYLIKGVAATEGEFKSGDKFTPENLTFGAGAMSTAAMMGVGLLNVDHFGMDENDNPLLLPEQYAKYGIAGELGVVGKLLDAAVEKNSVTGEDGEASEVVQVEWIGYTTSKKIYDLIVAGKFIGTSVEDWARGADCGDQEGFAIGCEIKGSHFLNLGLILHEVPDSHGTWVAPVTEDDLRLWQKNAEKNMPPGMIIILQKDAYKIKDPKLRYIWADMHKYARQNQKLYDLDDYIDETGRFKDGKEGIKEFLLDEIMVPEPWLNKIADYLWEHPGERTKWQMEMMSAADWVAWFAHIELKARQLIEANLRATLKKHNIECKSCGKEKQIPPANHIPKPEEGCPDGWKDDPDDPAMCIEAGEPTVDMSKKHQAKKKEPPTALIEKNPAKTHAIEQYEAELHKIDDIDVDRELVNVAKLRLFHGKPSRFMVDELAKKYSNALGIIKAYKKKDN